MDVVMAVLGDMARDRCRREASNLNSEAIVEVIFLSTNVDVAMSRQQRVGKICESRRALQQLCKACSVKITKKVRFHMSTAGVVAYSTNFAVEIPVRLKGCSHHARDEFGAS